MVGQSPTAHPIVGFGFAGASLAPYIATALATRYGLAYVGYYLTAAAVLTLVALLAMGKPVEAGSAKVAPAE